MKTAYFYGHICKSMDRVKMGKAILERYSSLESSMNGNVDRVWRTNWK